MSQLYLCLIVLIFLICVIWVLYNRYLETKFRKSILLTQDRLEDNHSAFLVGEQQSLEIRKEISGAIDFVEQSFARKFRYPLLIRLLGEVEWLEVSGSKISSEASIAFYDRKSFFLYEFHTINISAKTFFTPILVHELAHALVAELARNISLTLNEGVAHYLEGKNDAMACYDLLPDKIREPSLLIESTSKLVKDTIDDRKEAFILVRYLVEEKGLNLFQVIKEARKHAPTAEVLENYLNNKCRPELTAAAASEELIEADYFLNQRDIISLFIETSNLLNIYYEQEKQLALAKSIAIIRSFREPDLIAKKLATLLIESVGDSHLLHEEVMAQKEMLIVYSFLDQGLNPNDLDYMKAISEIFGEILDDGVEEPIVLNREGIEDFLRPERIHFLLKVFPELHCELRAILICISSYLKLKGYSRDEILHFEFDKLFSFVLDVDFREVILNSIGGNLPLETKMNALARDDRNTTPTELTMKMHHLEKLVAKFLK